MCDPQGQAAIFGAILDLKQAARVASCHDGRFRRLDMIQFSLQELISCFGLDNVVNASTPATPVAFGEFLEFQSRNATQHVPRLARDLLAVGKMTGFVIGDYLRGIV